jgi:uncharacterized protein
MPLASPRVGLFLGVTFAGTWGAWGLLAALAHVGSTAVDQPTGIALFVLGGSAPTAAAYLAVWRTPTAGSLREFNRRVLRLRASPAVWGLAVLGAAAMGVASLILAGTVTEVVWPDAPGAAGGAFLALLLTSIVFGGIEEVGWRGVLQPAVTARWRHLVVANLVIAAVWGLWHLPLFWVVGGTHDDASFGLFVLAGIGYSAVMTWLYARTHSVALCVVFHAGINAAAASGLAFPPDAMPGFAVQAVVAFAAGTALLLAPRSRPGRR